MKALVIAIGNELLNAKTQDYNAYWITKRLTSLGVEVIRIVFVPDDISEIIDVLNWGFKRGVDLIICSGGLGPTPGDITLEAIAKFLKRDLVLDNKALEFIKKRYKELYDLGFVDSPEIDEFRAKMAKVPSGSEVIYNDVGVAPGVIIRANNIIILALPGVPSEMMYVLEKAIPLLPFSYREKIFTREERIVFGDESKLAKIFDEIMESIPGLKIKSYPEGFGREVHMRIILEYKAEKREDAEKIFEKALSYLNKKLKS